MIVQAYAVSDHRIFGALDVSAGGFKTTIQHLSPPEALGADPGRAAIATTWYLRRHAWVMGPGVFHSHVKMNL